MKKGYFGWSEPRTRKALEPRVLPTQLQLEAREHAAAVLHARRLAPSSLSEVALDLAQLEAPSLEEHSHA